MDHKQWLKAQKEITKKLHNGQISEEPLATLGELAFEYGFKETKARRILRDHKFNKNGGRWVWYEDEELEEVKKAFDEYK